MKLLRRIVLGVVALVAVAACVLFVVPEQLGSDHPVSQAIDDAKIAGANAAIDATGIKSKAQQALEDNTEAIAQKTGLPLALVTTAVSSLDIESWKVASLPSDAVKTGSADIDYNGIDAVVTTYTDPSIVTVDMYGQSVTLEVPEASRQYVKYLTLL